MRRLIAIGSVLAALATGAAAQWQLEVVATGAAVVPPVATAAKGFGVFTQNQNGTVSYFLVLNGVAGTSAEVRLGTAGVNGALLFTLAGGPVIWEGSFGPLAPADAVTMRKQGMYLVVPSVAFPGGEIRGQIEPTKKTHFASALDGAQVVPPVATSASGTASIRLNEPDGVLVYDLETAGIASATAARARLGAAGSNGPVVFTLVGAPGHWCGVSPFLTLADVAAVKSGGMYLEIASAAFPGGEVRGQIVPARGVFSCVLDGAQEVPPTGATGSGCGWLEFDPQTALLAFQISVTGLSGPPTGAHVHEGVTGEGGPIVFPMAGGPSTWTGSVGPLGAAHVDALYRGNLFVNVHTALNPAGEIRGQVRPDPYVFGLGLGTTGALKMGARGYGPTAGNTVTVDLAGALPNVDSFLFLSASSTFSTALNVPLPVMIPPVGNVYTDMSLGFFFQVPNGPAGCPKISFPVPTDPALACFKGYAQWATIDAINPFNFVLTDAIELTILP
jgi:hypothetical protein